MVRHLRKSRKRRQHGGAYTYDGITGLSAGGVPLDARTPYDHCYTDPRAAMTPTLGNTNMFGGATAPLPVKGGGCDNGMCGLPQMVGGATALSPLKGGGSGSGGYGFTLNNDIGKVYADVARAPCLNASGSVAITSSQQGGSNPLDLVSYPAGYDMARPYSTDSAHFLEPVSYDRMCAGGRRSRKQRGRKQRGRKHQSRKNRKHKKQSRKH
jgi:hypothetical protein